VPHPAAWQHVPRPQWEVRNPPGLMRALQSGLPIARGGRGGRGSGQQFGHQQHWPNGLTGAVGCAAPCCVAACSEAAVGGAICSVGILMRALQSGLPIARGGRGGRGSGQQFGHQQHDQQPSASCNRKSRLKSSHQTRWVSSGRFARERRGLLVLIGCTAHSTCQSVWPSSANRSKPADLFSP
jgi:hypothetical protein